MFSRSTHAVWIGIILLSGMFLMGQEPWGQVPPPGIEQIFVDPAPNSNFGTDSGVVTLSGLAGATICYTTDGSQPTYDQGSCTGGTTQPYTGSIDLACDEGDSALIQKTVSIVFEWNSGPVFRAANFFLVCPVEPNITIFDIEGTGTTSGAAPGTVTVTGAGELDEVTGILSFNLSTTSVTDFTNMTTEGEGTISGTWANPIMSSPVGTATTTACTNNGGLIDACGYVTLDTPADMGIVAESDPITFDLAPGGETAFSTSIEVASAGVTTDITYILTAIDPNNASSIITERLSVTPGTYWEIMDDTTGGSWVELVADRLQISCAYDFPCDTMVETVVDGTDTYLMKTYTATAATCPHDGLYCDIHVTDQSHPSGISRYPDTEVSIRVLESSGALSSQEPTEEHTVTCVDEYGADTRPPARLLGHNSDLTTTPPSILYLGYNVEDGFMYAEGAIAMFGMPSPTAGVMDCSPDALHLDGVPIE